MPGRATSDTSSWCPRRRHRSLEWLDHGKVSGQRRHRRANAGNWLMSNVCRHRQAIMLQGATSTARRLPHPSLDLRPGRATHRRAAFSQNPCLNLDKAALEPGTACFSGATLGQGHLAGMNVAREFDFSATSSTTSRCTCATTTGRPSSRFISRTTMWFPPPGLGNFCHLRRPDLAVRRMVLGAEGRHHVP